MYVEVTYKMLSVIDVEKYHTGRYGAPGCKRQPKRKRTPEEIRNQNYINACKRLRRIINNNFEAGDLHCTLTYKQENRLSFVRNTSWCLFVAYLLLVICSTVLFRNYSENTKFFLLPLWSYKVLDNRIIAESILNVLLFLPIGFLLGAAIKHSNLLKILAFGFGLSVVIEAIQILSRRGVCNIDDVIHNTLGCAIGYALFWIFYKMARKLSIK